jgi:hypothetical protein
MNKPYKVLLEYTAQFKGEFCEQKQRKFISNRGVWTLRSRAMAHFKIEAPSSIYGTMFKSIVYVTAVKA